ncbi:hypothetical protein [Pedobacter sp. L105]|uniref:hypothetical protein n=1 Tax=Pedobacter sp. L105 TaxID=1641871 RepID=UPI00131BCA3F|nr:hypothetical protein [Pedobacter sp. L105]
MRKLEQTPIDKLIQKLAESKNIQINLALLGDLVTKPLLSNTNTAKLFLSDVRTIYNWRLKEGLVSKQIRSRHFYLWDDILSFLDRT